MKGKSKSKKVLASSKQKVSIESMYKKYKSQESYNDFKIITKNLNSKIAIPKQNCEGSSPNNINNNIITNNFSNANIQNLAKTNINVLKNSNKNLKLKNFFDVSNSYNNVYKMISPNSLRSNILTGNSKAVLDKLEKTSRKPEGKIINKENKYENSIQIDDVNNENQIFDNLRNIDESDIKINNLKDKDDKDKRLFLSKKIEGRELREGLFKNSNNFYTNSICEGSESFIEKGDNALINNLPDTFVRQTENKLLENKSSKKLIEIKISKNNKQLEDLKISLKTKIDNRENKTNSELNKRDDKENKGKSTIFSTNISIIKPIPNIIKPKKTKTLANFSESYIKKIDDDDMLDENINIIKSHINLEEKPITPKRNLDHFYATEKKNTLLNLSEDSNQKVIQMNINPINPMNILTEIDCANKVKNPNNLQNSTEYTIDSAKKETGNRNDDIKRIDLSNKSKIDLDLQNKMNCLSEVEIFKKNLLNFSKRGDKESFLETLAKLYKLEGEKLDIYFFDENGKNCLHIACEEGNLKIVEILIKLNFNLNFKQKNKSKKSSLHISCEKGYFDISKQLIEKGADLNLIDEDFNTPLHSCCQNGHIELMQYMLEKQVNISAVNKKGEKPFDLILKNCNDNMSEKIKQIIFDYNLKKNNISNNIVSKTKKNPNELSGINNSNYRINNTNNNFENVIEKNKKLSANNSISNNISMSNLSSGNNSNQKSSKTKEIINSSGCNNYISSNSSNFISDTSTSNMLYLKKDSNNVSNSQFSNYKSNFKNYKNNQDRKSVNTNTYFTNQNNFFIKNIINLKQKNSYETNNNGKSNDKKSNIPRSHLADSSNSSNSTTKFIKKNDFSASSNAGNSVCENSKFKKVSSLDNLSGEYNNCSNSHSHLQFNDDNNYASGQLMKNLTDDEKIGPSNFICHLLIGKGSFGEVYLVEEKNTSKLFAMKTLQKDRIMDLNLIKYALTERNVLSIIDHPFIVKLYCSFQTIDKLFLILDFCPGGDLSEHLTQEGKFSEEKAKIYLCEIILAIEDLHKKDIIFRDLKPDNVVIDADGHALLTDFGLSKEGVYDNIGAKSFCGSIAYLAPEMLSRQGHGKSVDWYLLGVLFYEMLVGLPPFFNLNKEELFKNIETGHIKYPDYISHKAKDLLKQLLNKNPYTRLGSGKDDAGDIKIHPYFSDVNWDDVYNRKLNPPKPKLKKEIFLIMNRQISGILDESQNKDLSIFDNNFNFDKTKQINYIDNWSFIKNN